MITEPIDHRAFTFSKSAIEILEKSAQNMFKVKN